MFTLYLKCLPFTQRQTQAPTYLFANNVRSCHLTQAVVIPSADKFHQDFLKGVILYIDTLKQSLRQDLAFFSLAQETCSLWPSLHSLRPCPLPPSQWEL